MYPNSKTRSDRRSGFTLTEVLVATTISAMVSVGLFSFFLTNYKIGFVNQERNRINADMRGLTGKLIQDGRQANYFVLYESAAASDHDEAGDRVHDGGAGDVLLFVYTEKAASGMAADRIKRFVCYYRLPGSDPDDPLTPVRRLEKVFSPASDAVIEDLVPEISELAQGGEVVELSRGLADGRLFYNFRDSGVMVNAQIYHGNAAKRVTETYNFTVSPRG